MTEKLELQAAEMRALGYRVIDVIVDHFEHLTKRWLVRKAIPWC